MFHEKLKLTSFSVIQTRLFIVHAFEQHMRFY